MKKLYEWGWANEGKFFRRRNWMIRKPNVLGTPIYQLRIAGSKPGKLEAGEGDYKTLKEAMKAGNQNIRQKIGK